MSNKSNAVIAKVSAAGALFLVLYLAGSRVEAAPEWLKDAIAAAQAGTVDADAPALILRNSAEVTIRSDGSSERRVYWALKVLKKEGIDEAVMSERVSAQRSVKGFQAWRVTPDGTSEAMDKNRITYVDAFQAAGYYDDERMMVASFPKVNTGDVVGCEYRLCDEPGYEGPFQTFEFQSSLPVLFSSFEVTIPQGWNLYVAGRDIDSIVYSSTDGRFSWTSGRLAYRPDEPYSPSAGECSRYLVVSCADSASEQEGHFNCWHDASLWAWDLFQQPSDPDSLVTTTAREVSRSSTTDWEKVAAIARYVQDKVRYVAIEIDEARFRPRAAATTLVNKFGDCKDKATLMRSMLRAVGLPSYAVLTRVGGVVEEAVPSPFQFNHAIIALPLDSLTGNSAILAATAAGWLYFDPSDPSTPLGLLPTALAGAQALKLSNLDSSIVTLPVQVPMDRRRVYKVTAVVNTDNSIGANVAIVDYGNLACEEAYRRRTTAVSDQIQQYQKFFSTSMKEPTLANFKAGSDNDSAWVTFDLSGAHYVTSAGGMVALKPDLFMPDRYDVLDCAERSYPVSFGHSCHLESEVVWHLPEEWTVVEVPDTIQSHCDIASAVFSVGGSGPLQVRTVREYRGGFLGRDRCSEAMDLVKSLRAITSSRILVKQ